MSNLVIGLTGGIGSGKSAVSDRFAALGVPVVDADVIARDVVEPGKPALQKIIQQFGQGIITQKGELDRNKLRQIVFDNPQQKVWLNNLLHPLIRQQMITQARTADYPFCILAIPLLVENQLFDLIDCVLVVDVPEDLQLQRAALRDNQSAEQIRKIMASQVSREKRLAHADDVIDNSGTLQTMFRQVDKLHAKYLLLAKNKSEN